MPTPRQNETQQEFVSRCVASDVVQQDFDTQSQRLAVCYSQWRQSQERDMDTETKLLSQIKNRKQKNTQFNYGILTADRYVKTLQDGVGLDFCYKYASTRQTSFDDVLTKASNTLVYSNPDMVVQEKKVNIEDYELPKNTLMAFSHVLTTSRKDRDGDILRTKGAEVDPNMLLLWQHVHTLPIGKMIAVTKQSNKELIVVSAIVDMNELSHDAAVMIDNKMGRFSHGFRALEYEELKEEDPNDIYGFDIKRFEVMEESLVSVPANSDAETQEVLLSLVEDGKMTSPLMKEYGKSIKERRNVIVPGISIKDSVGDTSRELTCNSFADLKAAVDAGLVKGVQNENESGSGSEEEKGKGGSSPEEANEAESRKETKETTCSEIEKRYAGELDGSWEWIERTLRGKVKSYLLAMRISVGERDWVRIIGTYSDYVVVCVEKPEVGVADEYRYFKISWEMKEGEPSFYGEPTSVNITTNVEVRNFAGLYSIKSQLKNSKSGRTISKANETKLIEVKESLNEILGMDGVSRTIKALVRIALSDLEGILASLSDVEETSTEQIDIKQAITFVLTEATKEQQTHLLNCLKAIEASVQNDLTSQYRDLIGV